MKVIDKKGFNFHPYIYTPQGISPLQLFGVHNREIISSPREAIFALAIMMGIMAPTLLTTRFESREDVAIYNPQKAMT